MAESSKGRGDNRGGSQSGNKSGGSKEISVFEKNKQSHISNNGE